MIIIPYLPWRRAAEALETTDLMTNIMNIEREITLPSPNWVGCEDSLGEFGLVSLAVLRFRGMKGPTYSKTFREVFKGVPCVPRWVNDFLERHRSYLVLLGWLRLFEERGAGYYWCEKNQIQHITKLVAATTNLPTLLKVYDSRLTELGLPVKQRSYSNFREAPAAYKLQP